MGSNTFSPNTGSRLIVVLMGIRHGVKYLFTKYRVQTHCCAYGNQTWGQIQGPDSLLCLWKSDMGSNTFVPNTGSRLIVVLMGIRHGVKYIFYQIQGPDSLLCLWKSDMGSNTGSRLIVVLMEIRHGVKYICTKYRVETHCCAYGHETWGQIHFHQIQGPDSLLCLWASDMGSNTFLPNTGFRLIVVLMDIRHGVKYIFYQIQGPDSLLCLWKSDMGSNTGSRLIVVLMEIRHGVKYVCTRYRVQTHCCAYGHQTWGQIHFFNQIQYFFIKLFKVIHYDVCATLFNCRTNLKPHLHINDHVCEREKGEIVMKVHGKKFDLMNIVPTL